MNDDQFKTIMLAIAGVDSKIDALREDFESFKQEVREEIEVLCQDVATLRQDMESHVKTLKSEIKDLAEIVSDVANFIDELRREPSSHLKLLAREQRSHGRRITTLEDVLVVS